MLKKLSTDLQPKLFFDNPANKLKYYNFPTTSKKPWKVLIKIVRHMESSVTPVRSFRMGRQSCKYWGLFLLHRGASSVCETEFIHVILLRLAAKDDRQTADRRSLGQQHEISHSSF